MRCVTIPAVEILFEHELAMTRDQYAVELGRGDRILRYLTQNLDELLDLRA
jgi:hypothetical protein